MASPSSRGASPASPAPPAHDAAATITASQHGQLDPEASTTAEPPSPPPFEPLFTLLTNTTNNTTVHPRVRYLFSDDDPSVLTSPPPPPSSSQQPHNHRTLVVDLAPAPSPRDGWAVSWAASLSPDFAVTESQLSVQHPEAADEKASEDADSSTAMMLRVEGVEREHVDARPGDEGSLPSSRSEAAVGREDVEGLVDDFRRRMGVLRKVVAEGERRRELVGGQVGEDQVAEAEVGHAPEEQDVDEKVEVGNND